MKSLAKVSHSLSIAPKLNFGWNSYLQRPGDSEIRKITCIPGNYIGPEITSSIKRIFSSLFIPVEFQTIENFSFNDNSHKALLLKNPAILLGVISPFKGSKYSEISGFYKFLDLYAQMVAAYSFSTIKTRHQNVDIAIIRENTEGEYSGIEHEVYPGVMESIRVVTKSASLRIAEYAFEFAYLSGRKKVTAVHKANIMKICDGLFLQACREVSSKYPMLKYEEMIIDNCTMQLVKNPKQFDVIVTLNLYGTILSNVCAGITGGVGMTAGASIGKNYALFSQGCTHTGKDIAGKNTVNPTALILSSIMMLRYLNLPMFADTVTHGLKKTINESKKRTADIGGSSTTIEFTDEVIKNCQEFLTK